MATINAQSFLWTRIRIYWGRAGVATAAALLGGAFASAVGLLVGPSLQLLMSADGNQLIPIAELLGERMGEFFTAWTGVEATSLAELGATVPKLLLLAAAGKAVLTMTQWYLWEVIGEKVALGLRRELAEAYLETDPAARASADQAGAAEVALSSAITNDVRLAREYVVHNYGGLPREAVQCLFLCAGLVLLSPSLFGAFVLGVLPAVSLASKIGRKIRRRASSALREYATLTEWLQQRFLGIETIKHYSSEGEEIGKMRENSERLVEKFSRAVRVKAMTAPVVEFIGFTALAAVLVLVLSGVYHSRQSGATYLSFFATAALMSQSASRLAKYFNANREAAAAIERVIAVLAPLRAHRRPDLAANRTIEDASAGGGVRVSFEGVTVRYPRQERPALAHFSAEFSGGKFYCISGPSGAGKTTLLRCLLGTLTPDQGRLCFALPPGPTSLPLLYVPQDVRLMSGTIAENVAYPATRVDERKVNEALRAVGLEATVACLRGGIHAAVENMEHAKLSGGQVQRMLLARMCYHDAPIVVIDEGTSAQDPDHEAQIIRMARAKARAGAVVIMVAHRDSVIAAADEVIRLQAGVRDGGT